MTVKKHHISRKMKLKACGEGVGGAHSTNDDTDNKTVAREGDSALFKRLEEVRASECPKG